MQKKRGAFTAMYYVYILTNKYNTTLYTGVTRDIDRRFSEHISKLNSKSFTAKYNLNKLVYYEEFNSPELAIEREKQIKNGSRQKKVDMVNSINPKWKNLLEPD